MKVYVLSEPWCFSYEEVGETGKAGCFDIVLVKPVVVIIENNTKKHKYLYIIYYELLINLLSIIFSTLLSV